MRSDTSKKFPNPNALWAQNIARSWESSTPALLNQISTGESTLELLASLATKITEAETLALNFYYFVKICSIDNIIILARAFSRFLGGTIFISARYLWAMWKNNSSYEKSSFLFKWRQRSYVQNDKKFKIKPIVQRPQKFQLKSYRIMDLSLGWTSDLLASINNNGSKIFPIVFEQRQHELIFVLSLHRVLLFTFFNLLFLV